VTGSADHLKETIRPFLDLPDDLRIAKINSDHWIGYGRALAAQDRIRQIQLSERRERPDNLFIVGPSNNGKTMIADRFLWSARRRQVWLFLNFCTVASVNLRGTATVIGSALFLYVFITAA